MKTKKNYLLIILSFVAFSLIVSCDKDDDDSSTNSNSLSEATTIAVTTNDDAVSNVQSEIVSITDIEDQATTDYIAKSAVITKSKANPKDTAFASIDKAKIILRKRYNHIDRTKDTTFIKRCYGNGITWGSDDYSKLDTILITHIGDPKKAGCKTIIKFSKFKTNGNSVSGTIEKYRKIVIGENTVKDSIVEKDFTVTINDTTFVRNFTVNRTSYFSGVLKPRIIDSVVVTEKGTLKCEKLNLIWEKSTITPLVRMFKVNNFRYFVKGVNVMNLSKINEKTLLYTITKTFKANISIPFSPVVTLKIDNKITGKITEKTISQKK